MDRVERERRWMVRSARRRHILQRPKEKGHMLGDRTLNKVKEVALKFSL